MKNYLFATAAVASLFAANISHACKPGEVCEGLTLEINDDRVFNVEGIGGIDLTGLDIRGTGHIDVDTPNPVQNAIEVTQTNRGDINSTLEYKGQFIAGDFESAVTGIANNVSIALEDTNAVEGGQDNTQNVVATSDLELLHLVAIDSISASVTAVANTATVEGTGDTIIDFGQENTGHEVTATLDGLFQGQGALGNADVDLNVTALGNNLSVLGDGGVVGSLAQHNNADITAAARVTVNSMKDPLNVTAVGNNLSISRINVQ